MNFNKNIFGETLAVLSLFTIPYNFIPALRVLDIPIPFLLLGVTLLFYLNPLRFYPKLKLDSFHFYSLYIFSSLPILFYSIVLLPQSYLTIIYSILPFLIHFLSPKFSIIVVKNIKWLLFGLMGLTILGWAIRLNIIDSIEVFPESNSGEIGIGYWGIRYMESSRNADYLYPLFGAYLCFRFFKKNLIFNIVGVLFILTGILSLSRGAMLISGVLCFYVFQKVVFTRKKKYIIPIILLIVFGLIGINSKAEEYQEEIGRKIDFKEILSSIISGGNKFSNNDRQRIYRASLKEATYNPFGYGIDNFQLQSYPRTNSAENAFLTILIERGWIPSIIFLTFFVVTLYQQYQNKLKEGIVLTIFLAIYLFVNYELNNFFTNFLIYFLITTTANVRVKKRKYYSALL
jgi:hypothetical protein